MVSGRCQMVSKRYLSVLESVGWSWDDLWKVSYSLRKVSYSLGVVSDAFEKVSDGLEKVSNVIPEYSSLFQPIPAVFLSSPVEKLGRHPLLIRLFELGKLVYTVPVGHNIYNYNRSRRRSRA